MRCFAVVVIVHIVHIVLILVLVVNVIVVGEEGGVINKVILMSNPTTVNFEFFGVELGL